MTMKYYIPTSSLNFNNILSTESISPKVFYGKRGFGYRSWWSIEENNIDNIILLFDNPQMFQRPCSDIEDHEMLIEIETDYIFKKISSGVYYSEKTIYLNAWQTKIYFFSDKVKRTVLSLSDSSLETKMVRLYQRRIIVTSFEGQYPIIIPDEITVSSDATDKYIKEDRIINKMKGLLYGYYIGANLSSTKELIKKIDTLREIQNIFLSIISSDDKVPSLAQHNRLNALFDFLDQQQPIYRDIQKEVGSQGTANNVFNILKRYGYSLITIDRDSLIRGLQSNSEYNSSLAWVNKEITTTNNLIEGSKKLISPKDAEIIVSSKDKLVFQRIISDEIMAKLFMSWINDVLCSDAFDGKVASVRESLSDEITKAAKTVLGKDWDNSPIRTFLNQLRRHIRGDEFNQDWNNDLLSSIAAVLIKGDDWEQLLYFMQNKEMYDYRLAYAFYGTLNGFANMTRDFSDLLLNKHYSYLSEVYYEFHRQLHNGRIYSNDIIPEKDVDHNFNKESGNITSALQDIQNSSIDKWRSDIRNYAETHAIKLNKNKLLATLDDALSKNGENQDYFIFLDILKDFDGWKPGKSAPSTVWKRMQKHYVPDYYRRAKEKITGKKTINNNNILEKSLFDTASNCIQDAQNIPNKAVPMLNKTITGKDNGNILTTQLPYSQNTSILIDTSWIKNCALFITNDEAREQFIIDMKWFIDNYKEEYYDKRKGRIMSGKYFGQDRSNSKVLENLKRYLNYNQNPQNDNQKWIAVKYSNIPIDTIMDYLSKNYAN